jgi:hypothetical protein
VDLFAGYFVGCVYDDQSSVFLSSNDFATLSVLKKITRGYTLLTFGTRTSCSFACYCIAHCRISICHRTSLSYYSGYFILRYCKLNFPYVKFFYYQYYISVKCSVRTFESFYNTVKVYSKEYSIIQSVSLPVVFSLPVGTVVFQLHVLEM